MKARNTKGFTLVEIMIVVVIIGLLAAMAIPAFQKVRQNSIEKTLANDARQIASAANQYYLESGGSIFVLGAIPATNGLVPTSGSLYEYVRQVSRGNVFPVSIFAGSPFTGGNAALPAGSSVNTFSTDGQKLN